MSLKINKPHPNFENRGKTYGQDIQYKRRVQEIY